MEQYKILWIDDEYETLELIHESASENDIELIGFDNAEDALKELTEPEKYDAVLLDGLFHMGKTDKGTPSKDTAFGKVATSLTSLKASGKILPWFILSGKTKFTQEQNSMVEVLADKDFAKGKVFDKKKPKELPSLWEEIKNTVDSLPDSKIKHEFHKAFEICTDKYLGDKTSSLLLQIIKNANKSSELDSKDYFLSIRKLLELLFEKLNKNGIVPDAIFNNNAWFNPTSDFLTGKKSEYKINEGVIHPTIAFLLRQLKEVSQDAEHNVRSKLRLKSDDFISSNKTPYLYKSAVFQLLDILIWFKNFLDVHPNRELNSQLYSKIKIENSKKITGIIQKDMKGNYHCNGYALNPKYTSEHYSVGEEIEIIESDVNTHSKTKNSYPQFATKFKKISK